MSNAFLPETVVAKFAHDMASPLGGVVMALDMLEGTINDHAGQESLKLMQDSVLRMRALIGVWRHIFLEGSSLEETDVGFKCIFEEYFKAVQAQVVLHVPVEGAKRWQMKLLGILFLALHDRLHLTSQSAVHFERNSLKWTGSFGRGDFFDRLSPDKQGDLSPARTALPQYFNAFAQRHGIQVHLSQQGTHFTCQMSKGI